VKADMAPYRSNQAESIDSPFMEGFMFVDSKINKKVIQVYQETHYCVLGLSLLIFQAELKNFPQVNFVYAFTDSYGCLFTALAVYRRSQRSNAYFDQKNLIQYKLISKG
jgi:hypothetical protein